MRHPWRAAGAAEGGGKIIDVVIMSMDQGGFPFLDTQEAALNRIIQSHEARLDIQLLCGNLNLIYPTTNSEFGSTTGAIVASIAGLLE